MNRPWWTSPSFILAIIRLRHAGKVKVRFSFRRGWEVERL